MRDAAIMLYLLAISLCCFKMVKLLSKIVVLLGGDLG